MFIAAIWRLRLFYSYLRNRIKLFHLFDSTCIVLREYKYVFSLFFSSCHFCVSGAVTFTFHNYISYCIIFTSLITCLFWQNIWIFCRVTHTIWKHTHTHTHTHTQVASKLYIYARFVGCCSSNLQWNHRGHEWWVSLLTVDWLSSIQLSRIFIFFVSFQFCLLVISVEFGTVGAVFISVLYHIELSTTNILRITWCPPPRLLTAVVCGSHLALGTDAQIIALLFDSTFCCYSRTSTCWAR